MIKCPNCDHSFMESDQKCTKCNGTRFVEVPVFERMTAALKAAGVTVRKKVGSKSQICPRCNGAGTELAAKNRNNRKRGASNEYKAVDTFKPWWLDTDGKPYEWAKTPQSGGSPLAEGFDMAGDIATKAPDFRMHVECKRTQGWDFGQLMNQAHNDESMYGDMLKFTEQVIFDVPKQAGKWTKIPLLWLMHPGPSQPTYIMLIQPATGPHDMLQQWCGILTGRAIIAGERYRYHIMGLKLFLKIGANNWRTIIPKMLNEP